MILPLFPNVVPARRIASGVSFSLVRWMRHFARELAEELSLSVRNPRLWRTVEHDYDFRSVRLHFFHITEFSGEPVANDGQAFRWVTPEEALTLPFLEADRPLLFDLSRP